MDTLPVFRRTLARAGLEDDVVAVVGPLHDRLGPLAHAAVAAVHRRRARRGARPDDYTGLGALAVPGAALVIHDVFPDPADGGQPPYDVFLRALAGGGFERGRGAGLDAGPSDGRRGRRRPGRLTRSRTRARSPGSPAPASSPRMMSAPGVPPAERVDGQDHRGRGLGGALVRPEDVVGEDVARSSSRRSRGAGAARRRAAAARGRGRRPRRARAPARRSRRRSPRVAAHAADAEPGPTNVVPPRRPAGRAPPSPRTAPPSTG